MEPPNPDETATIAVVDVLRTFATFPIAKRVAVAKAAGLWTADDDGVEDLDEATQRAVTSKWLTRANELGRVEPLLRETVKAAGLPIPAWLAPPPPK